jgi:hypothetical protein
VADDDSTRDPGWGGPSGVIKMLVPFVGMRVRGADPVLTLRRLFISFCVAIVLIGFVLTLMDLDHRSATISTTTAVAVTAVAGVVGLGACIWCERRPLRCDDAAVLASSYRTRFFMQIACVEYPALIGFVLAVLSASIAPYLVAAAFTAIGFAAAAPTHNRLARDQRRLREAGCDTNLIGALRGSGPDAPH